MPENTRKVDRATIHGNPFPVEKYGREQAVQLFREWLTGEMTREVIRATYPAMLAQHLIAKHQWVMESLPHLRGKNLACWCSLPDDGEPDLCHAAVLMELANSTTGNKGGQR